MQKGGDYRESFQPAHIAPEHLAEADRMADKVTRALTGAGIWGVEFFLSHKDGVYFSELSPRPHDTGMVTLAGTQNFTEFELHLRAVLGLPIPCIKQMRIGASAVILSPIESQNAPEYEGLARTCEEDADVRIFGKPTTRVGRRMGVVVCNGPLDADLDTLRDKAKRLASYVTVKKHTVATQATNTPYTCHTLHIRAELNTASPPNAANSIQPVCVCTRNKPLALPFICVKTLV